MRKVIFVTGPNGAGKEYICENVMPVSGVPFHHNILSTHLKNKPLPVEELERINKGHLISDRFVCETVEEIIERSPEDSVIVIDGFPRNEVQSTFISANYLVDENNQIVILHIDASKQTCFDAMMRRAKKSTRRPDDNPIAFEARWAVYETLVLPGIRRIAEDFPVFTVYGGIHIPDEIKLAPILRMFNKLGFYLRGDSDGVSKLLKQVTHKVKAPKIEELEKFLETHPKILKECPQVHLAV